jgi:hypothetical protein
MTIARVHRVLPIAGVVTILAASVAVAAAVLHVGALAGLAGLMALATGAAAAGVDSRSPGDWVTAPRR